MRDDRYRYPRTITWTFALIMGACGWLLLYAIWLIVRGWP